jgi:ubiquinone/menaquinone biosynthesis C-methylase UbiE
MSDKGIQNLKTKLYEISKITDDHWMGSLNTRKKIELEFHDEYRDQQVLQNLNSDTYDKVYGNKKYYSATTFSKNYINEWIKAEAKDLIFLDYCCGDGTLAIQAAKAGAKLSIGIDISLISIRNAKKNAGKSNVTYNSYFVQADAENTLLPDGSIDRIICSGVLHHLDIDTALSELNRILAPGGKILAIEALDYNPAIKLYRRLTPDMRTEWEKSHILSLKDVGRAKKHFTIGEIKFWHILGILQPHMNFLAPVLHFVDKIITRIPIIQLMAWIFTFELKKDK